MKRLNMPHIIALSALLAGVFLFAPVPLRADAVTLQNGTATFSQFTDDVYYGVDKAVDGSFDAYGWAIAQFYPGANSTNSETAVWETSTDVNSGPLTFRMHFLLYGGGDLLGRFRFSVTTDNRNMFADGLDSGGDVSANWIVLENPSVQGPDGMTFTTLPDNSILAGGTVPLQGVYCHLFNNSIKYHGYSSGSS
jgi:hypothetical protein